MNWRSAVVAGLVLLAGCNSLAFEGGPTRPTETLTPAPVETGTTPTADPDAPPGVSAAGGVDLTALLAAHDSYLESSGDTFTWVVVSRETVRDGATTNRNYTRRVEVGEEAFLVEQVEQKSGRNVTLYVPERTGYLRTSGPLGTEYEVVDDAWPHFRYDFSGELLGRFLNQERVSVRVVERNGQMFYRLHTTRPGPEMGTNDLRETVSNYAATAYVTPEGFVRSMIVSYDRTVGDLTRHTYVRFDYTAVGETTVSRPGWTDELPPSARPGDAATGRATAEAATTPTTAPRTASATTATGSPTPTTTAPADGPRNGTGA